VETGARLSEVLRAKWEDIDFEAGTWRIPSPKTGTPQVVPLNSQTMALLRRLPHVEKCPYICSGRYLDRPRADLKDAWQRVKDRADAELDKAWKRGRAPAGTNAPTVADVHVHDLRRTFGLHVARKAGLHVASQLLRHADIKVTQKVYAPLGIEELRTAVENRGIAIAFPQPKKKA
jgi:integrase